MLPTLRSSAFHSLHRPHAVHHHPYFPLHPAPLQCLFSSRSWYGFSATFTAKERSAAQSQTFVERSVLFVGVLRGGTENVTPWV